MCSVSDLRTEPSQLFSFCFWSSTLKSVYTKVSFPLNCSEISKYTVIFILFICLCIHLLISLLHSSICGFSPLSPVHFLNFIFSPAIYFLLIYLCFICVFADQGKVPH